MRVVIEGQNTEVASYVLGWIARRLGDLHAVHHDIASAVVMLTSQPRQTEARIELVLARKTLRMSQHRKTQGEAVLAALRAVESQLDEFRT